jgi:hypothetical protein
MSASLGHSVAELDGFASFHARIPQLDAHGDVDGQLDPPAAISLVAGAFTLNGVRRP